MYSGEAVGDPEACDPFALPVWTSAAAAAKLSSSPAEESLVKMPGSLLFRLEKDEVQLALKATE